jgi:hypothetical protein
MGFLISQNGGQIRTQGDKQSRKFQAQRFVSVQVNGEHRPLSRPGRKPAALVRGMSDQSLELSEVVPLVCFVFSQKSLDVWRHILQLRRAHGPERHSFGFQKSCEQRCFTLQRQSERFGMLE